MTFTWGGGGRRRRHDPLSDLSHFGQSIQFSLSNKSPLCPPWRSPCPSFLMLFTSCPLASPPWPSVTLPWPSFSPLCSLLFEASLLAAQFSLWLSQLSILLLPVQGWFMIFVSKIWVIEKKISLVSWSFGWAVHCPGPENGAGEKLRFLLALALVHWSAFSEVSKCDVEVTVWSISVLFWLFWLFHTQNKVNMSYSFLMFLLSTKNRINNIWGIKIPHLPSSNYCASLVSFTYFLWTISH